MQAEPTLQRTTQYYHPKEAGSRQRTRDKNVRTHQIIIRVVKSTLLSTIVWCHSNGVTELMVPAVPDIPISIRELPGYSKVT